MDKTLIDRPVFVIGTGRCGSTIVIEALAMHEDLGWFSNFDEKFPHLVFTAAAPRVHALLGIPQGQKPQGQKTSRLNRFLPKPVEAYSLWDRIGRPTFSRNYLLNARAEDDEAQRVRGRVGLALRLQGKSRFLAKFTGPPRICYLASIFGDARFIHVIRDEAAVVRSLLKREFWRRNGGLERPAWDGGLPETWREDWERQGRTPWALAAMQYRFIIECARRERTALAPDQYFELRYEDFVAQPLESIERIIEFCDLAPSRRVREHIAERSYRL